MMPAEEGFEVGDLVVLKSGSPELTVAERSASVLPSLGPCLRVVWLDDDNRPAEMTLPEACFVDAPEPPVSERRV